jgi:hypothetical protein
LHKEKRADNVGTPIIWETVIGLARQTFRIRAVAPNRQKRRVEATGFHGVPVYELTQQDADATLACEFG